MDHKTALNLILANACQQEPDDDGTKNIFITMHCYSAHVKACLLTDQPPFEYEIVSVIIKEF